MSMYEFLLTKNFDDENPGVWVEVQCEQLGVSMTQLSRDARIERSTIWRWKHGHSLPSWDQFQRVAKTIKTYRETSIWTKRSA